MDEPVYGRSRCHWVLENPFPLRERQVAGEHDAAPFITVGQKSEQHFHLLLVLFNIPDVVNDDRIKAGKSAKQIRQA